MNYLWSPWRMAYIGGEKKPGCVLCQKVEEGDDRANLVLYRGRTVYVLMNLFPYNPGHLMVVPYAHVPSLSDLPDEVLTEIMTVARHSNEVLRRVMSPDGFNLGMNLGEVAGAGIADHLHLHIVPRWTGDTNFMPIVGQTKVLPEELSTTYDKLHANWGSVP